MTATPLSYCEYVATLAKDNIHRLYHDTQYGFPLYSDDALFGRLVLEINQAGLSWDTILKKQANFYKAYSGFCIKKVAKYHQRDIDRLLSDAGIVRNRLKIQAIIWNAQQILVIQKESGSFRQWLDYNHPLTLSEWVKLFKKTFRFTGDEITKEFLMSTGYLSGAHIKKCHMYKKILKQNPKWSCV